MSTSTSMSTSRLLVVLALLTTPGAVLAQEKTIAIRGGTVLPVSGPAIPNGTVVIRGTKIVAVGAGAEAGGGADAVEDLLGRQHADFSVREVAIGPGRFV